MEVMKGNVLVFKDCSLYVYECVSYNKPSVVAQVFDPIIQEAETE